LIGESSLSGPYRTQPGIYIGWILKGERPTDLLAVRPTPGHQPQNRQGAVLNNPDELHAIADEVIE